MAFCRNCGAMIQSTSGICPSCGTLDFVPSSITMPMQPITQKNTNGSAITSLVLGIVGIILCMFPYIGTTINVIGLVFGIRANKTSKSGVGTAGFVLSLVGLVLSVLIFIVFVVDTNNTTRN